MTIPHPCHAGTPERKPACEEYGAAVNHEEDSMKARITALLVSLLMLTMLSVALREAAADDFYQGKTIRFVVGFAAGGGYDLAARIVGRHMGKHIPGNPTIVVENMTGAGSLIAANYTYNSAKPDGLFVGIWNSAYVLRQALGDKAVRLDARKLGWKGSGRRLLDMGIRAHNGAADARREGRGPADTVRDP
jgi:hypothetical protein